jgi:DNA-3-methyladenine glycosylase I
MNKNRCGWINTSKNQAYIDYHDTEWGAEHHGDKELFKLLCLEGAQAGLTWEQILNRRADYDESFWGLDPEILVYKSDAELLEAMTKTKVIQNRLKTLSLSKNARGYMQVLSDYGSFNKFIWSFVGGKQIVKDWATYPDPFATIKESEAMSKALKKYGFSFVGPTICYAFMQAAGLAYDHEPGCFLAPKTIALR